MSTRLGSRTSSATLADVLSAVLAADLPERRGHDMASAVRAFCSLIDRRPDEVPLDLRGLALRMKGVAPLAHGMSQGRWNNIRSLLRAAIVLVRPVMPGRSKVPMLAGWEGLYALLPRNGYQNRLSRLLHWLSA